MRTTILILVLGLCLGGCADEQQAQPSSPHYGPPTMTDGMQPSTGMGNFTGAGSWGPGNPSLSPAPPGGMKGFRGF